MLQNMTRAKLDALLATEVELRREREQMAWMDSLVRKNAVSVARKIEDAQQRRSDFHDPLGLSANDRSSSSSGGESQSHSHSQTPHEQATSSHRAITAGQLEFLQIWKHHTIFRNAASRLKPREYLEPMADIKPDIGIKADLQIYQDLTLGRGNAAGANSKTKTAQAGGFEGKNSALRNTLKTLQTDINYLLPPKPSEDMLMPLLQTVVDLETEKIQSLLNAAISEDDVPLPATLRRPAASGDVYGSPGLLDLLTTTEQGHGGLYPAEYTDSNLSRNALVNHKRLYYSCMRDQVGSNPPLAREIPKPVASVPEIKMKEVEEKKETSEENEKEKRRAERREKRMEEKKKKEAEEKKQRVDLDRFEKEKQQELIDNQAHLHAARLASIRPQESQAANNLTDPNLRKGLQMMPMTPAPKKEGEEQNDENALSPGSPGLYNIHTYSATALTMLASHYLNRYGLSTLAQKRLKQLQNDAIRVQAEAQIETLSQSELLTPDEASRVFYSLPFFAKPPACKLLYSTLHGEDRPEDDDKSNAGKSFQLNEMYTKCMLNNSPSLILIQSGSFVFGAYLSHPLRVSEGKWVGAPTCFLFSVTLDLKLPYHARNLPEAALEQTPGKGASPVAFMCGRNELVIGNGDLIIKEGGLGSSGIENCYGIGLNFGSSESECLLAGQGEFPIDEVECWMISPS